MLHFSSGPGLNLSVASEKRVTHKDVIGRLREVHCKLDQEGGPSLDSSFSLGPTSVQVAPSIALPEKDIFCG